MGSIKPKGFEKLFGMIPFKAPRKPQGRDIPDQLIPSARPSTPSADIPPSSWLQLFPGPAPYPAPGNMKQLDDALVKEMLRRLNRLVPPRVDL